LKNSKVGAAQNKPKQVARARARARARLFSRSPAGPGVKQNVEVVMLNDTGN